MTAAAQWPTPSCLVASPTLPPATHSLAGQFSQVLSESPWEGGIACEERHLGIPLLFLGGSCLEFRGNIWLNYPVSRGRMHAHLSDLR